jgi:hypothetical protein
MNVGRIGICAAIAFTTLGYVRPNAGQFKSGTALVEVDVIVLDKQGRFVPGLRAEDLSLFEDGKPQQIQQFYMVTYDPGGSVVSEYSSQADHQAQRVFILLFDEVHLSNDSMMRVKRGAEEFIQQLGPKDIGGVFVGGGMFRGLITSDKTQLIAGIHTVRPAFDNRQALRAVPRLPASRTKSTRPASPTAPGSSSTSWPPRRARSPIDCNVEGGVGRAERHRAEGAFLRPPGTDAHRPDAAESPGGCQRPRPHSAARRSCS